MTNFNNRMGLSSTRGCWSYWLHHASIFRHPICPIKATSVGRGRVSLQFYEIKTSISTSPPLLYWHWFVGHLFQQLIPNTVKFRISINCPFQVSQNFQICFQHINNHGTSQMKIIIINTYSKLPTYKFYDTYIFTSLTFNLHIILYLWPFLQISHM